MTFMTPKYPLNQARTNRLFWLNEKSMQECATEIPCLNLECCTRAMKCFRTSCMTLKSSLSTYIFQGTLSYLGPKMRIKFSAQNQDFWGGSGALSKIRTPACNFTNGHWHNPVSSMVAVTALQFFTLTVCLPQEKNGQMSENDVTIL